MQTIEQLEIALAALNAQRSVLGGEIVDLMIAPLQQKLQALRQPAPGPLGERKLVTIMFADISGFTAMSETLDPEHVRHLMNGCFDALVPCIHRYGGTIDKFIGDAVMALFGAPVAQENHAESAARASLEMLHVLAQFNLKEGTSLGIHIGINTGLVVAGGMGSQDQQQYSVMGDAVNLAARLEDASETGEILLGEGTYRLIAPLFDVEALTPLSLKGKSEPVANYRLIAVKSAPGTLRGLPGLHSPLVGRLPEHSRLHAAVAVLRAGIGSRFAILGDAGIGKSRLIAEVRQTSRDQVDWIEGRALSYTTQMSFFVARQHLLHFIGLHHGAATLAIDEALRAHVEATVIGDTTTVYLTLARLLDLPVAQNAAIFEGVTPQGMRSRMLNAYSAYVRARAQKNPLVMVWEDLHWADPSSLALLELLLPLTDAVPLLLVLVSRGDENPALRVINDALTTYGDRFEVCRLAPLTPLDSEQLMDNLLKVESLPSAIRHLVLNKAEGNAFFIEEIIRSLIDAGVIAIDGGNVRMTDKMESFRAVDIPPTLQGVIAARIDRLPALDKKTLQIAAVIGRLFQHAVLAFLYKQEITNGMPLDDLLLRLLERELIHQSDESDYLFKHAATHDVAYSTLLLEQRKRLHRTAAQAIASLFPSNRDELAPTLAFHYKNADMPNDAWAYLLSAAKRAQLTYANAEAISFYRSALEQFERVTPEIREAQFDACIATYESLGSILVLTGQRDEARLVFQRGLHALDGRVPIAQARLNRLMANSWMLNRHREEAERYLNAAQMVLGDEGPDVESTWWHEFIEVGLERLWFMYWFFTEEHLMRELVLSLEPSVTRYGTPTQRSKYYRSRALYELSSCHWFHPDERVVQFASQAVAAAQQGATQVELCFAMFGSAFVRLWRDELDMALSQFLGTLALAERCGDSERLVLSVNYATLTYRRLRRSTETQSFAERTVALAVAANMPIYAGQAKGNLAWVHLQHGEYAAAETTAREAMLLTTLSMPMSWTVTLPLVAALYQRGETTESVDLLAKTLGGLQRLAPPVEAAMRTVIAANAAQETDAVLSHIGKFLDTAKQHTYL